MTLGIILSGPLLGHHFCYRKFQQTLFFLWQLKFPQVIHVVLYSLYWIHLTIIQSMLLGCCLYLGQGIMFSVYHLCLRKYQLAITLGTAHAKGKEASRKFKSWPFPPQSPLCQDYLLANAFIPLKQKLHALTVGLPNQSNWTPVKMNLSGKQFCPFWRFCVLTFLCH